MPTALPAILEADPAGMLQHNNDTLGDYLQAITNAIKLLHEKDVSRGLSKKRKAFNNVAWLVGTTRKAVLGRYYKTWVRFHEGKRRAVLNGKLKTVGWVEKEYQRMTHAIQDILGLLSKERDDKAIIQSSVERLAIVCNETQKQMQLLSDELGETFRNDHLEGHFKAFKAISLSKEHNKNLLAPYFSKFAQYRLFALKVRKRLRATRHLLKSSASSLLRSRLRTWMVWLQSVVNRKVLKRMNKQTAFATLHKKTKAKTLATYYKKLQHNALAWRKYRKNHKKAQYLITRTLKSTLHSTLDKLLRFPLMKRAYRTELAVARGINSARAEADRIQKRVLEMHVASLREKNCRVTLQKYWFKWGGFGGAVRRLKRHARAQRYLVNKLHSVQRAAYFKTWQQWCKVSRRRQRVIDGPLLKILAKNTALLMLRYYKKLYIASLRLKKKKRHATHVRYLVSKSALHIVRRAYDKLAKYATEAVTRGPDTSDVAKLMGIVENLVTQTGNVRLGVRKQQVLINTLRVRHLIDKNNKTILRLAYMKFLLHKQTTQQRRRRWVAGSRLSVKSGNTLLRDRYEKLAKYCQKRKAFKTKRHKQQQSVGHMAQRNCKKMIKRYFKQWTGTVRKSGKSNLVVMKQIRVGTRHAAMAILQQRGPAPTRVLLQRYYEKLCRATQQRGAQRAWEKKHRMRHQNLYYLYNANMLKRLNSAYQWWKEYTAAAKYASRDSEEEVRRWMDTQIKLKSLREKLVSLDKEVRKTETTPRDLHDVNESLKAQLSHVAGRLEKVEKVKPVDYRAEINEVKTVLNEVTKAVRGLDEWKNREADRTGEMAGTVAALQRQMSNTSSVLNKLIDRLMAVDEHLEKLDKRSEERVEPPAPDNSLRSSKAALPTTHLAYSTRKPVVPPGPPDPTPTLSASTTAKVVEARGLRNISPPRHARPSPAESEHLTLLHATGQLTPESQPSLPPTGKKRNWV
eukprot:TRINITY_DN37560_c0_g1_i1.p1 TRINITY_DN37560_c0_g1~~TRINITY_DN37560_c0_g1_i1.p1  ORF type:complete len:966 (+),score=214.20 TRINITY_DN37560_c0_g1_i1:62-2959(+)